jgi:hypothetical protein
MPDLVTVIPFALVGMAMVVFGLVLNRQSTLSARRIDAMTLAEPDTVVATVVGSQSSGSPPDLSARTTVETNS